MDLDEEGFLVPQIDRLRCINCGACTRICPSLHGVVKREPIQVLVAVSRDERVSQRSSSGGVFYVAAKYVIEELHGCVCGAVLDESLSLRHIVTDSMHDVKKMQGSKYIQSDISMCFHAIRCSLQAQKVVLFCGTPCQVAAVKKSVGNLNGLITMDLICHGTPSAYAFAEYMHRYYPAEKYLDFSFRQKNKHIKSLFAYHFWKEGGASKADKCIRANSDPFYHAFLSGVSYRESCYLCQYAQQSRCGDITIGDCANYRAYSLPVDKELSTVCINTDTAERLWHSISGQFDSEEADYEKETQLNRQLHSPVQRSMQRDEFYDDLKKLSWDKLRKKYCPRVGAKTLIKELFVHHTTPQMRELLKHRIRRIKDQLKRR